MRVRLNPNQIAIKNLKIKIFALFGAIFLWLYVAIDNQYVHGFNIPVRPVHLPQEWIFLQPPLKSVKVLFQGTGKAFLGFLFRDRYLELDIQENPKNRGIALQLGMIHYNSPDSDFRPLRILESDTIFVHLDQFSEKKVPIQSNISVTPQDGYVQVGSIRLKPDSVRINGPASLIQFIDHVPTKSFIGKRISRNSVGKVKLEQQETDGITHSLKYITYSVEVQRIHEEILTEIPVHLTHVTDGLRVQAVPSTVTLHLQGGVDILRDIDRDDILVTIDYRNRHRYIGHGIPASIEVPKDVTFSNVTPQFFDLLIE